MPNSIDKQALISAIIAQLQQQLTTAEQAVAMAADTATHSETVAKSKYDTFGLEASYLAQGQQQRLLNLQQDIQLLHNLSKQLQSKQEPSPIVGIGSIIALEDEAQAQRWFFIAPAAGGQTLAINEGISVTVITDSAPLALQLLNKELDDEILHNEQWLTISRLY